MDWKQLLTSITSFVDEELCLRNVYPLTENRILRNQIQGRLHLSDGGRTTLAELGKQLGKKALEEVATIAQPDTPLAWHRKRRAPTLDASQQRKAPGRPTIAQELEALVVQTARENRSWGYDRIAGALANLGYTVSDQTVGNILKRHSIPPAPERKQTTTWREFIRIHMAVFGATDFFSSAMWSWCALIISFLLLCVHCGRGKIPIVGMMALLHEHWTLPILQRFPHGHTVVARGRGTISELGLSRLMLWGDGVLRRPLAECVPHDHRDALPQDLGQVVRLPTVKPRPIRAGPIRGQQQLGGLWEY